MIISLRKHLIKVVAASLILLGSADQNADTGVNEPGLAELLGTPEQQARLDEITKSKETLNQAQLLHLGLNSKKKRLELLEQAENYVFITVPYWFGDQEGKLFLDALSQLKQRRPNIDIKVMMDWTSPASTSDFFAQKFYKDLQKLLGKKNVVQWNKLWNFRSFSLKIMSNRIHDKVMVIDGKKMISGGMNIGNDYLLGGDTRKGWHDTDIYLDGPAALEGSKIFLKPFLLQNYFNGYFGQPFPRQRKYQIEVLHNLFYRDIDKTTWPGLFFGLKRTFKIPYREYLEDENYFPQLASNEQATSPIRLIYDNPLVDRKEVEVPRIFNSNKTKRKIVKYSKFIDTLEYIVPQAKKSLRLFIPYLTISKRVMKLLLAHSKRIRIEIITNSMISHDLGKFNYFAALPAIKQLVDGGITVYEWQGHSKLEALEKEHDCEITDYWPGHTIHTKAAIIDSEVAFLGSHNMNVRSEKYNSELMIMMRDKKLAQQMEEIFNYDLDLETDKKVRCGEKILERPARTEKITEDYLEKTVRGFKFKLLPLLYPVM
jgi:putative cardiolipin synthase